MPPLSASRWHSWKTLPALKTDERALSKKLGWPVESLSILNHAFSQRLDRKTGWEIVEGSPLDPKALALSASVFKRGVACRLGGEEKKSGTYEIRFKGIDSFSLPSSSFVVLDKRVAENWADLFKTVSSLHVFEIDEHTKNLESVAALKALWTAAGSPPHWTIIGGGVLCDTAGFAAALLGCAFTLIPTTLLAMVDACVGGKTGVNHAPYGKNQIGLFAFPDGVSVYPQFLSTLPPRELKAGWAEALKHALLTGEEALLSLFDKPVVGSLPPPALLARFIAIKAEVVRKDPTEQGLRATLNLGHTLAHALEAVALEHGAHDAMLHHGEAVALGLLFCLLLSSETGVLKDDQRLLSLMQSSDVLPARATVEAALGTRLSDPLLFARLEEHFAQDKKSIGGISRWILLDAPGCVRKSGEIYLCDVKKSHLQKAWRSFISFPF